MKDIGKNIRALRIEKGITQEALAETLFVTRQTVSNYETGHSRPDVNMIVEIAAALGTDANCLLYGPPVPESRKAAYHSMAVAGAVLVILAIAAVILHPLTDELRRHYYAAPHLLVNLVLDPALMLVSGWCVMQGMRLALSTKPLSKPWTKWGRLGILILLAVCAMLLCPFLVTLISIVFQTAAGSAYEAGFAYLPVYQELLDVILNVNLEHPAVYLALGCLLWTFGFPHGSKSGI